jgi:hypothetical protein
MSAMSIPTPAILDTVLGHLDLRVAPAAPGS